MINETSFANSINNVLKSTGILDVIKQDSSVYVGGSLPSFIVSQQLANKNDEIKCNDIDLYTTNYVKTLHNFSKHLGNKITDIKRTGVNVTFLIKDIPIQIITSEFNSFYHDVLGNYDCTLVAVGFYPFENKLIMHQNFLDGLENKNFVCHYEKSNPKRIEKLSDRAEKWYGANLQIFKQTDDADFRPYYKWSSTIDSLQDIVSPPHYVQLYYNKFKCINCDMEQTNLLCEHCTNSIEFELYKKNKTRGKKITILGGVNGLGNIIKDIANNFNNEVYVTSRNPPIDAKNTFKFVLGEPVSDELMKCIQTSDIVILNAYSTLDGNDSIWLTTLDTFDEVLALDKFTMNTIGYVRFLKEFVSKRKEYIKFNNLDHNISMVFMDANESRFKNKLMDGKHLELNLAKTATKQIFYTNANLLASLGVLTVCFDINWVSWHGIPIERKESKSGKLIPPNVAVLSLLHVLGKVNFDECIDMKKVIFDSSVYEVLKTLK